MILRKNHSKTTARLLLQKYFSAEFAKGWEARE